MKTKDARLFYSIDKTIVHELYNKRLNLILHGRNEREFCRGHRGNPEHQGKEDGEGSGREIFPGRRAQG